MSPRFFAWLLAVVFLVCSCAAPACSSRPLAADGGDATEPWAAVAAGFAAAARGPRGGGRKVWDERRSLGNRTPWMPPSPLSNGAAGMPAPPPPWV